MQRIDDRIPVILLTGFLGSGKTTILNKWLNRPELSDTAVIVNEFGEIGIDHTLIASSNDNTIELSTGCLCCTVRGDLVETLRDLADKRHRGVIKKFNRVVIETTGLADPVPVLQAIITFPVAQAYRLIRALTVVDGVQGVNTIERHSEAARQVAIADALILSKFDLPIARIDVLRTKLQQLNPRASLHCSSNHTAPPIDLLLFDGVYSPAAKTDDVKSWFSVETNDEPNISEEIHHRQQHHHAHDINRHNAQITSFCLSFDTPLIWEHVAHWLDSLVIAHGADLLRVKGILDIAGREKPIVVQAVQKLFHPPTELPGWKDNIRRSQIVFITHNLSRDYVAEVFATIRSSQKSMSYASGL